MWIWDLLLCDYTASLLLTVCSMREAQIEIHHWVCSFLEMMTLKCFKPHAGNEELIKETFQCQMFELGEE